MSWTKKLHINIFDILIILLIISVLGSLLWLRAGRKSEWITLRMVVANDEWWYEGAPPQWWYVDSLSVGQTSKSTFGGTIAEITGIESFDVGAYRRRAYIDIRLRGTYDKERQMYLFNYQPVQIGKPLDLTFGKNNVHGIVTYIDQLPLYTERVIEVVVPAVRLWVADSFHEGLEMKDSQGNVLAKILSVNISPSSATEVIDVGDKTQKKFAGAAFQDVTLNVRIKTFRSENVDYFVDRAAIKIGEQISLQFPQTVVREAEITKIIQ